MIYIKIPPMSWRYSEKYPFLNYIIYRVMNKISSKISGRSFVHISKKEVWTGVGESLSPAILAGIEKFQKMERTSYPIGVSSLEEWNEILEKIRFALYEIAHDRPGAAQYMGEHGEIEWKELDELFTNPLTGKEEKLLEMSMKEIVPTDFEGMRQYEARIQEGLELFGKYFQSLWD